MNAKCPRLGKISLTRQMKGLSVESEKDGEARLKHLDETVVFMQVSKFLSVWLRDL